MAEHSHQPPQQRRPWEASMSVALGLGLGFFVLTAVASVLGVGLLSGYQNTIGLLRQKAELLVSSEQTQTRRYLDAAQNQVSFLVDLIRRGEVEPGPAEDFTSLLFGALAATPQMVALLYIDNELDLVGAERMQDEVAPLFVSVKGDDALKAMVERAAGGAEPLWGPVLWREEYGQGLLNFQHPVVRDGAVAGVIVALVSVRELSEFISELESEFGENAFILYGEDQVLAHPLMAFGYDGLTRLSPLPKQASFGDPVLASMWEAQDDPTLEQRILAGPGIRSVALGDTVYVFLHRSLTGYSDRPLLVGTYFRASDLVSELGRLKWAVILCLVISVASSITAAYIGRQIARPVRRLADGANRIHDLDLAAVEPIPGSVFKELNDAAHAFNAMLEGLRWFERYVPKTLVRRLIHHYGSEGVKSSARDVVIMFTDLSGFTASTQAMDPPAMAAFLNEHLSIIARCVEDEGGTIDKYIGDAVMAVWGAPDPHEDMADRACRAALAIDAAIRAVNAQRRAEDATAIRVRIGIHAGHVMVGNIGSPGRINYTVVGDAVNIAERLEERGREVGNTGGEVNILISSAVERRLRGRYTLTHLGMQPLRGRPTRIAVSVLNAGTPA
jgi:class 3 adenylate cyclase